MPPQERTASAQQQQRLHVAVLIASLGPGGAEGVVARLASAWARAGDEVTVVTLAPRAHDFFAVDPAVRRIALDRAGDSRSRIAAIAANVRRLAAIRRALRDEAPHVVLSFVDRTNVLALLAAAGSRLPVVVCERTDPTRHVLERPWAQLRRALYPRARALVVQHEGLRPWAASVVDPARVLVLPNPVDLDALPDAAAEPPLATHRIVALGRLTREKGFDRLIDAYARVAARLPEWRLILTGDGPERARLEAMIAAGGLGERVLLRGLSASPWQGTHAGDVFVLPSRYEGMSNALLEAMARGLAPVVTREAAGLHGVVQDGASAVVAAGDDATALAAAIERVATDARLRATITQAAQERARRYAVRDVAAAWRAALVATLAGAR